MMVTQKSLSRRTLLKGLGAAISLPLLDAMTPAFARAATTPTSPTRLAWFYLPNGIDMRYWTPTASGALSALPEILAPFDSLKGDISVLSNLTAHWGRPLQDGAGDHGRALGSYMTGVHVLKTAGADIKLGVSADQLAANVIGHQTRLPSLEVGLEEARQAGNCDSGYSCAYAYNVSWKSETQPMPPVSDPRGLFDRLFGADADQSPEARVRRRLMRQSILDEVLDQTHQLESTLGGSDRRKVDEFLTSVREVERQVQHAAAEGTMIDPGIDKPFGVPADFSAYFRLMTDMMLLAFKADITRISTILVGREGSVRSYPEIGVTDGHHPLTHHQGNMDMLAKVRQINVLHATLFAEFIQKMKNTPDGDGTLLDHSLISYGSGLSDGNSHTHDQLPTLVAGRAGGAVSQGRHIVYQRETPLTNLFATMIEHVGVTAEHIGDSSGRLADLSL